MTALTILLKNSKTYLIYKINCVISSQRWCNIEVPEGKKFYGSVTVSERGQIIVPAEARKDFGIKIGNKLLVLGDLQQGITLIPFDIMARMMEGTADFFREVGLTMSPKSKKVP